MIFVLPLRLQRYKKKNEMRKYLYILIGFLAILLLGCEKNSTTNSKSSIAKLTSFSFAANDSMPGLASAVFSIDERIDTGLVYNKDSILYGTSLERVVPKFTFQVAVGTAQLKMPDTTLVLTGSDTLNFEKLPIYLTITSTDGTNTKVYEIRPTVHQGDPDLFVWTRLTDTIQGYPNDESEQRVVELKDEFILIANNGFQNSVYSSADGANWTGPSTPSGLPAACRVRQIISDGTTLYYAEATDMYTSTDAVNWTKQTMSYEMKTMLLYWNDLPWVLVDKEGPELAFFAADSLNLTGLRPSQDFPVSDFASVNFNSPSGRERAMIIGGFAENGKSLNTRWNLEYSTHITDNKGYRLREFSIDQPNFSTMTGVSVIFYDDQLMLFGGVDANQTYFGRDILVSNDEGITWTQADTAKNQLPEVYTARQKQTAIVRNSYIYLFGGQNAQRTFCDVYRGKLNSIDW